MKKNYVIFLVIIAFIAVNTTCKKKDKTDEISSTPVLNNTNNYLNMTSTYNQGTFPSEKGTSDAKPVIDLITGNSFVINGGSNNIQISFTDPQNDVDSILVGIKGKNGYYSFPYSSSKKSEGLVDISLLFTQEIYGNFIVLVALEDYQGNISPIKELPTTVKKVGTGKLQVSLSWDKLNDLDLHLVQPDSTEIFYADRVGIGKSFDYDDFETWALTKYTEDQLIAMPDAALTNLLITYAKEKNYPITGGQLDLDSNPACEIDSINNENITYNSNAKILDGEYIVKTDYFQDCSNLYPTNYTVTVRYNGELITPTRGSNPYYGRFDPSTDDHGDYNSGVEAMRFTINSTSKTMTVAQITYPNQKKASKSNHSAVIERIKKIGKKK